jgi:hypothetical protein
MVLANKTLLTNKKLAIYDTTFLVLEISLLSPLFRRLKGEL